VHPVSAGAAPDPKWPWCVRGSRSGEAACVIRNYEVQFVPGQLQTADYARAVIRLGYPEAAAEEIERRTALRISRQQLLARPDGPHFWAVLDEAALRRPLGGPGVMRDQVDHLIEAAARPTVTVRVIPFRAGGHPAAGGAFSLLRFPEPDLPDVVYLEQLTSALHLDRRADVDSYHTVMERLCLQAAPPTPRCCSRRSARAPDPPGLPGWRGD
jgi:hypothetical protein